MHESGSILGYHSGAVEDPFFWDVAPRYCMIDTKHFDAA